MSIEQNSKLIHDYLDENNWKYRYIPEKELYLGSIGLKGVICTIEFFICMSDTHVTVYCRLPVSAKDCLRPMAEFITRANYGLHMGCFELDFRDGEIRYKMSISNTALEANPDDEIGRIMSIPCSTIDTYSSGIIGVLSGYEEPEEAVKRCEEND